MKMMSQSVLMEAYAIYQNLSQAKSVIVNTCDVVVLEIRNGLNNNRASNKRIFFPYCSDRVQLINESSPQHFQIVHNEKLHI